MEERSFLSTSPPVHFPGHPPVTRSAYIKAVYIELKPDYKLVRNCLRLGKERNSFTLLLVYLTLNNKCSATYIGETSRNLYTRGLEHQDKFEKRKPDSFMYNHQKERHPGDQPEVAEGFLVMRCKKKIMNRKFEFRQPTIVRVRREVNTGVTNTVLLVKYT